MSFENGTLSLDSENDAYYAGHTLNGKYEFTIQQPTIIRGLYAKFSGYASVSWSDTESQETNNGISKDFKVEYKGEEQFLDTVQYLVGNNFGELTLAPGGYSYDYKCYLPSNLPSTFDHAESGFVEYSVTIHVVTPSEIKEACNIAFNIVAPLDLNMHPQSKQVTLHSLQPKSNYEFPSDVVGEATRGPVPCDTTRRWTVDLDIPALVPSNLLNCKLIDVFYKLEVEVVVSGCNDNLTDDQDIIIGTIPIVGFQDNIMDPSQDMLPSVPPPPQQPLVPANTPYPSPPWTAPYNSRPELNSQCPPCTVEMQNSYCMTQISNLQPVYPTYPMSSNTSGSPPTYLSNLPCPTLPSFNRGVITSNAAPNSWGTLPTASAPSAPPLQTPDTEGHQKTTPGVGFPYNPATSH